MLEMKSQCERCQAALPLDASRALICSYECTGVIPAPQTSLSTAVLGNSARAGQYHAVSCSGRDWGLRNVS